MSRLVPKEGDTRIFRETNESMKERMVWTRNEWRCPRQRHERVRPSPGLYCFGDPKLDCGQSMRIRSGAGMNCGNISENWWDEDALYRMKPNAWYRPDNKLFEMIQGRGRMKILEDLCLVAAQQWCSWVRGSSTSKSRNKWPTMKTSQLPWQQREVRWKIINHKKWRTKMFWTIINHPCCLLAAAANTYHLGITMTDSRLESPLSLRINREPLKMMRSSQAKHIVVRLRLTSTKCGKWATRQVNNSGAAGMIGEKDTRMPVFMWAFLASSWRCRRSHFSLVDCFET